MKKVLVLLLAFVSGAVLTRAWDATHVDPILIGENIPGVPCQISVEKMMTGCRIIGGVRWLWLPSRLEALDGAWTISEKLPLGYHAAPPPRENPSL